MVWLWASGQTINIMTLGGLALAVGVLVDEATVEIENIHTHMAGGLSRPRAVLDACHKTAVPRLLSMLCVLSVFVPSFFMVGVGRQLFVPLSLAVGFAMVSSYLLSSTLVPGAVHVADARGAAARASSRAPAQRLRATLRWHGPAALAGGGGPMPEQPRCSSCCSRRACHSELFPQVDAGQFQLRLRAPTGTRIERTELIALQALDIIQQEVGPDNVQITTGFIGVQPASYPINTIYLCTSGPQEAVLTVALKPSATAARRSAEGTAARRDSRGSCPARQFSFEAGDIVSQVMSFGSPTPIEVAVQGPNLAANRSLRREAQARNWRRLPPCATCNTHSRSTTRPSRWRSIATAPASSG